MSKLRVNAFSVSADGFGAGPDHQTLRLTPAMKAGISDHVRSIEKIVKLLN